MIHLAPRVLLCAWLGLLVGCSSDFDPNRSIACYEDAHCPDGTTCDSVSRDPGQCTTDPQPEDPDGTWSHVAVGAFHSCAKQTDGEIVCFGRDEGDLLEPRQEEQAGVETLDAGDVHTCALDEVGHLSCWGWGGEQVLNPPGGSDWHGLSAGGGVACALDSSDRPVCWGSNTGGQAYPPDVAMDWLSVGLAGICGRTLLGTVGCWGYGEGFILHTGLDVQEMVLGDIYTCWTDSNEMPQCTGGLFSPEAEPPLEVPAVRVTDLVASESCVCGLRDDKTAECWSASYFIDCTAEGIGPPADVQWQSLDLAARHGCGIDLDGELHCWGEGLYGRTNVP